MNSILGKQYDKFFDMKSFVFFDKNGLTSTSANHIANKAKNMTTRMESILKDMNFLNVSVELLGNDSGKTIGAGWDYTQLNSLKETIDAIGQCHGLIAWLREAMKAKESLTKRLNAISFEMWAEANGKALPVEPGSIYDYGAKTENEVIAYMPASKRVKYYVTEAMAASIGKLIHPDGYMSKARKELTKRLSTPNDIVGTGRDAMLYTYTPSIEADVVEQTFLDLNDRHRELQATLNNIKYGIENDVKESESLAQKQHNVAYEHYRTVYESLKGEYLTWMHDSLMYVQKLKIIIPEELKDIYQKINE